jgi:protein-S-isoprenylcysteine O-methyltransferase Ste14
MEITNYFGMKMYGDNSVSIPQKTTLLLLETLIIIVSWLLLFGNGFEKLGVMKEPGDIWRRGLVFGFNLVVFIRMLITIFYLLKRKMPWEEAFSIPFAFALYYIGFSWLVYETKQPFDFLDALGIVLYVFGSYLNTGSELMRDQWKMKSENKGRLYTQGLFAYSMHINYFGDLLWVIGYALITRNWYSVLIVVFLFAFFVFFNIPKLDNYLEKKYKKDFAEYKKRTKKFIPWII